MLTKLYINVYHDSILQKVRPASIYENNIVSCYKTAGYSPPLDIETYQKIRPEKQQTARATLSITCCDSQGTMKGATVSITCCRVPSNLEGAALRNYNQTTIDHMLTRLIYAIKAYIWVSETPIECNISQIETRRT